MTVSRCEALISLPSCPVSAGVGHAWLLEGPIVYAGLPLKRPSLAHTALISAAESTPQPLQLRIVASRLPGLKLTEWFAVAMLVNVVLPRSFWKFQCSAMRSSIDMSRLKACHRTYRDCSRALLNAGSSREIRIAIIPTTTRSSTRVKPRAAFLA